MTLLTARDVDTARCLRIAMERAPSARTLGVHGSSLAGRGADFRDFRPYRPGDDLRRLDWPLFARHRRPFVRLADETRDLPLHLLVDVSRSMTRAGARAARWIAAFLGSVAVFGGDPVTVYPFARDVLPELLVPRGAAGVLALDSLLSELPPHRGTHLEQVITTFNERVLRGGFTIVVSDFFDEAGPCEIESMLDSLLSARHPPAALRLVVIESPLPRVRGELRLHDADGDATLETDVTDAAWGDVVARRSEQLRRVDEGAALHSVPTLRIDPERDLMDQLAPWFDGGVLVP